MLLFAFTFFGNKIGCALDAAFSDSSVNKMPWKSIACVQKNLYSLQALEAIFVNVFSGTEIYAESLLQDKE